MYSKQKSLTFGHYAPNDKVLNKKIPENPKYKHVKPAIDTGKNVRRHIDELKEKQKNLNHKKDEVFKRVKFSAFMRLAVASALECLSTQNANGDAKEITDSNSDAEPNKQLENKRVANVLMGIGELDIINEKKKPLAAPPEPIKKLPYLLLDVRDRDEFQRCHILTAKHYPAALLSRSMGYETEELKLYKNKPFEIIVIYDDDEVIATRVATTLVERGYDNIYLLSGGLKFALEVCPRGFTASSSGKRAVNEFFSRDDIIQQYIELYPKKANEVVCSSRTSASHSKKCESIPNSSRISDSCDRINSKHSSISSRKPSTSSAKKTEYSVMRPASESAPIGRSKVAKKAPWK